MMNFCSKTSLTFYQNHFFRAEQKEQELILKLETANIQVALEQEGDRLTINNILNEIEKYKGHTTVFVTGEFASL